MMTSKITFSDIHYTLIKSALDVTDTERKRGKLNARSVVNRFSEGMKIDVLVLKILPIVIIDDSVTYLEDDIRNGTRRCFLKLSQAAIDSGQLPVKTDFFKKIEGTDTVIIILHEVI